MQPERPDHSSRRRVGIVSGVIAASLFGAGAVAAQSPSPVPAATPMPTSGTYQGPMGNGWGPGMGGRQGMGGPGMGGRQGNGWGPGMGGRQGMGWGPGMGGRQGNGWGPGMGGPGMGGRQGNGWGPGMGGQQGMGRGDLPGSQGGAQLRRGARSAITVSAITAPVLSLATDDGWTRDVDTTGVPITRNGQTITLADVHVGDDIRLGETRNADGTWTVNQIEVMLAVVQGTVASVGTDSFTVTQADTSVVTVNVSDTTRWMARRGNATGLGSLAVGTGVVAEGVRAADGSIDAIAVGVRGVAPNTPVTPSASPSPSGAQG